MPVASGVATRVATLSGLTDSNPSGNCRIIFVATLRTEAAVQQLMSIVQMSASQLGETLNAAATQYATTQSGTDAGALSATFTVNTSVLGEVSLWITLASSTLEGSCTLGMQLEGRNSYKSLIAFL